MCPATLEQQVEMKSFEKENDQQELIKLPVAVAVVPCEVQPSGPALYSQTKYSGLLLGKNSQDGTQFCELMTDAKHHPDFAGVLSTSKIINGVQFDMGYPVGDTAYRGISIRHYQRFRFVLFFGDQADDLNHVVNLACASNPAFQLYGLSYVRGHDGDNTLTPQVGVYNPAAPNAPEQATTKKEAYRTGEILLSETVLNLIKNPKPALQQQRRSCSVM